MDFVWTRIQLIWSDYNQWGFDVLTEMDAIHHIWTWLRVTLYKSKKVAVIQTWSKRVVKGHMLAIQVSVDSPVRTRYLVSTSQSARLGDWPPVNTVTHQLGRIAARPRWPSLLLCWYSTNFKFTFREDFWLSCRKDCMVRLRSAALMVV